jgi:hypothetical protein
MWCIRLAGTVLVFLAVGISQAQEKPPAGKGGDGPLLSVFGKPRLAAEDVISFTNNDVLRGEVTNESIHITTPYSDVVVPLRKCAGISFEGSQTAGETVVTVNSNRITGIVTDRFIKFRIGSAGAEVPIRKEKIRHILLRRSPLESGFIESQQNSDLFIMANGDLLSGRSSDPSLLLRTDYSEIPVPFADIREMEIQKDSGGRVSIKKKNSEVLSGMLQTEEITLDLDAGIHLEAVYKDRFSKIEREKGGQKAALALSASQPPMEEMPQEPEEPAVLLATPTPPTIPTSTPTTTPARVASNTYTNEKFGFQIERPSDKWRVITSPSELKDLNQDAVVAFESEDGVYSMVIVEPLPGVPLDSYVEAVSPSLENVKLQADERGTLSGLAARKRTWQGTHNGLPFRFLYTLVAKGDNRIQIVSWVSEAAATPEVLKQINDLEDSFRPADGRNLPEKPVPALPSRVTSPPR